jgi:hypothetical protein
MERIDSPVSPAAARSDAIPTQRPTPVEMDGETIELLQRQNAVQAALLRMAKSHGMAFYRPHWKQHLFHTAPQKRRGLFAGNRFGKSQANAAETAAWMMGERTWYKVPFDIFDVDHDRGVGRRRVVRLSHMGYENHPLVRQGIPSYPTKQLIVCTNWDKVHEIWTSQESERPGKIWQMLPVGWAKGYTNHEGVISEIHGKNGSFLKFLSVDAFKRNKLTAESSDFDRVAFDEPGPEGLWKGCARGLVDRDGQGDFTLTSLEEMWIYDYFNKDEINPDLSADVRDRFTVTATMFDNPHLSDAAIARFAADLTEDEKSCRLEGLPLELSGLIYKEFKRDVHILSALPEGWRDWHLPAKDLIMYLRVDTHPVTPHAVSFFVVGPNEVPIQCNEIWHPCGGDELGDVINEYLKMSGCFVGGIKVEPAAWIKDPTTRTTSIAKQLASKGLFIRPASKDLTNGILAVRSALKNRQVFFTPNCRNTIREFGRYRYDIAKGKPVDENDHFMENLYRLIIDRPRFFNPDSNNFPVADEEFVTADLSLID